MEVKNDDTIVSSSCYHSALVLELGMKCRTLDSLQCLVFFHLCRDRA
jgi:hypothetical protein